MERSTLPAQSQWMQPKAMQRRYELRAGADTIAELAFQSAFGSLAVATSGAGRWSLKRVGFFNPAITLRQEGAETNLAVYRPKWTGTEGTIELSDGRKFLWKAANFWATQYTLQDADGRPLVLFKQGSEDAKLADIFKVQAQVEVEPEGTGLREALLLIILGWYIMLLQQEDSAAVAATAAT